MRNLTKSQIKGKGIDMRMMQLVLLVILFTKQAIVGCYIVDPTYDFAFKALFGGEAKGSKERLMSFLNSILNEEPFNITINDIKYLDSETQNGMGNVLRFDVRCSCKKQVDGKKVDFELDVEMQKSKQNDYFQRITRYSARLLDIYKKREQDAPQVNVIVISILDCVLTQCEEDIVFRVCSGYKETLSGMIQEQNGKIVLVDNSITHIGIQLPLYVKKLKEDSAIKYGDNPWLHLLASRRIAKGAECSSVYNGKYDFGDKLVTNGNNEIKGAIAELNRIATDTQKEYEEAILKANDAINDNKKMQEELDQAKEELAQKDEELTQTKRMLTRTQQIQKLRKQVKEHKKNKEKKPKRSELPEELKKLNKEEIKKYVEQYLEDASISELDSFLNQMDED